MSVLPFRPVGPQPAPGRARPETIDTVIEAIGLVLGPLGRRAKPDSRLTGDLAMDSLHFQTLAAEIEEHQDIAFADDEIAEWETVTDVALSIERRRARQCAVVAPHKLPM